MIKCFALTRENGQIVEIGSKNEMCHLWSKLKYQDAPEEQHYVKEIEISFGNDISTEEILKTVENYYR